MIASLTAREVAELSGAPKRTVAKAVEEKVILTSPAPGRRGGRVLPDHAVAYLSVIRKLRLRLDRASKTRLVGQLSRLSSDAIAGARFDLEPAVEVDLAKLVGDSLGLTERYRVARDTHIVSDPEILGGSPVIRGTRISVHALLGRVDHGDTVEDILTDHPNLQRSAVEAAIIFARSHPMVGRPGGRPWNTPA
jgi:uncharacterized protein (DUF433 family)